MGGRKREGREMGRERWGVSGREGESKRERGRQTEIENEREMVIDTVNMEGKTSNQDLSF